MNCCEVAVADIHDGMVSLWVVHLAWIDCGDVFMCLLETCARLLRIHLLQHLATGTRTTGIYHSYSFDSLLGARLEHFVL